MIPTNTSERELTGLFGEDAELAPQTYVQTMRALHQMAVSASEENVNRSQRGSPALAHIYAREAVVFANVAQELRRGVSARQFQLVRASRDARFTRTLGRTRPLLQAHTPFADPQGIRKVRNKPRNASKPLSIPPASSRTPEKRMLTTRQLFQIARRRNVIIETHLVLNGGLRATH